MRKPGGRVLVETSKLAHPSVNLVIRELLPEHGGSLKIGVVVVEYFPTCDIVLPSLPDTRNRSEERRVSGYI